MASDERLHSVAGLRTKETTPPSSVLGALADLPNPATGFGHLSDGVALPIHRPLANDYQLPDRGTESHGIDNDIPSDDMTYDDDILTGPAEPYDGPQYSEQLIAPKPVPVAVVSNPIRSELVFSDLLTVIGDFENWAGSVTALVPLLASVRQVLPYDDTRSRAEVRVAWSLNVVSAGGTTPNYVFALSLTPSFSQYIVLVGGVVAAQPTLTPPLVFEGKVALYGAIVPLNATSALGSNNLVLQVVSTRRQVVNQTL